MKSQHSKGTGLNKDVNEFMNTLEHPLKQEIQAVRNLILGADNRITEHIKWNAPSFCYQGGDRITFNLRPRDRIQLVFHRGAKVKDSSGFTFTDRTGMLEWAAADRAIVTLRDMAEVEARKAALVEAVIQWMKATSQ